MKISYMLKREDFYAINERTLGGYYKECNTEKNLYIYPELNAIVTARPSRAVRKYLYTEYSVSGSALKRLLVKAYTFLMLHSGGLFAARRVRLKSDPDRDTLIYPCNKKYRIFDFKSGTVSVIAKSGFPTGDIKNEIEFRKGATADFIPRLLSFSEDGYTEKIIDGYPVARAADRQGELSDRAYKIWQDYTAPHSEVAVSREYAESLLSEINSLLAELSARGKNVDTDAVTSIAERLAGEMCECCDTVTLTLSHGDLQPGNIWVENGSDKIYIIDWESYGKRSAGYDEATLYRGIRRISGLCEFVKLRDGESATVLLEDIVFRLRELINLPEDFGAEDFLGYLGILEERYV